MVTVFDIAGRTVYSRALPAGRSGLVRLDLREVSSGVYLMRLDADGFARSQKLVIENQYTGINRTGRPSGRPA